MTINDPLTDVPISVTRWAMQLRAYIEQRGIPISKFGQRVGVPLRQTMHKYVKGLSKPPREVMERIALETGGLVLPQDFETSEAA